MLPRLIQTTLVIVTFFCSSAFYVEMINNLHTHKIRDNSRFQILNSFRVCERDGRIDPNCIVPILTRMSKQYQGAQQIMQMYNYALGAGMQNNPKCQRDSFRQLNEADGFCVLAMHREAIETQNKEAGILRYQQCLSGAMITLAYAGNIGAQMRLTQIFKHTGDTRAQGVWQNLFEAKKKDKRFIEEYVLLQTCYSH